MRRAFTSFMVAVMAIIAIGPLGAPTAVAQSQSVDAWVEVATANPGVGCIVDVSAEIRSGGYAVEGAEVVVALSIDGTTDVISSDRATTDASGVAYLVIDTSAGWNGAKTWMEVMVNGSYLGGRTIRVTDGACSGADSLLDLSGDVPTVSDTVVESESQVESQAASNGGAVIIPNVPAYQQQRNLSCEYAALSIATGALGSWISEYEFDNRVGWSENPHWGYRGDITGWWGNTDDYGVYASALVPALNQFGFNGEVFYGDRSNLLSAIDQGKPTVVWLGMWGDTSFDAYAADGTRYQLTAGMHVMVAYGYDDGGVYLSDPATGGYRYYDWGTFEWMWNVMDGMSLAVSW